MTAAPSGRDVDLSTSGRLAGSGYLSGKKACACGRPTAGRGVHLRQSADMTGLARTKLHGKTSGITWHLCHRSLTLAGSL
jgi:hypothetical protein